MISVAWREFVNQGKKLEEEEGCVRQWSALGQRSVLSDAPKSHTLQTSPIFTPRYKELTQ